MRVLLILFLFATLASAEEEFGPTALFQQDFAWAPAIRLIAPGQLECVWGPLLVPGMPGQGRKLSLRGEPLGDYLAFPCLSPGDYTCPAEMKIVPTRSGGEARMIGHTWSHDIEIQFYSPEGNLLDTLSHVSGLTPQLFPLGDGLFLAYAGAGGESGLQLVWLTDSGRVNRRDSISAFRLNYGYERNDRAVLVESMFGGPGYGYYLHSVDRLGRRFPTDTVTLGLLTTGQWTRAAAFDEHDGSLVSVMPVYQSPPQTGDPYRMLIHFARIDADTVFRTALQRIDSFPDADNSQMHTCLRRLPDGGFDYSYMEPWRPSGLLTHRYLSAQGVAADSSITYSLEHHNVFDGFDLLIHEGTVYTVYGAESNTTMEWMGCFLVAFPLRYLMPPSATASREINPRSIDLAVYPNPFNGNAHVQWSMRQAGPVELRVFDLRGRQVADFGSREYSAGTHGLNWSADHLPSGMYLIRLSSPHEQRLCKAVLLR